MTKKKGKEWGVAGLVREVGHLGMGGYVRGEIGGGKVLSSMDS